MAASLRDSAHSERPLLELEDAVAKLLASAAPLRRPEQAIPLREALGRVLAQEVALDRPEPPVARSAMDGYAVRSADGASPRRLGGTIYAGTAEIPVLAPGMAVAVMTGGSVPPGADAVVPVERAHRAAGGSVLLDEAPRAGQHVRAAGEMGPAGRVILAPGRVLAAPDLAAAASCGTDPLRVRSRPRFRVLSTGDEVRPWRERPAAHEVRDGNRLGAVLQLERAGGEDLGSVHVGDDPAALRAALAAALADAELVVTIGGVSMGAKDYLPGVFAELGVECLFHGVSVQPGKPVWAGRRDDRWVLGLPGNPVSSFVILELLGWPLVRRLGGATGTGARALERGLSASEARAGARPRFLPASLDPGPGGVPIVRARPEAGSGDWTSLALADALLHLPAGASVRPDQEVLFLRLA